MPASHHLVSHPLLPSPPYGFSNQPQHQLLVPTSARCVQLPCKNSRFLSLSLSLSLLSFEIITNVVIVNTISNLRIALQSPTTSPAFPVEFYTLGPFTHLIAFPTTYAGLGCALRECFILTLAAISPHHLTDPPQHLTPSFCCLHVSKNYPPPTILPMTT